MSGLTAIVGTIADDFSPLVLEKALNRTGNMVCETKSVPRACLSVARHRIAPGRDWQIYSDQTFFGAVSGDIVNLEELDWRAIMAGLSRPAPDFGPLTKLRGAFALVLHLVILPEFFA